MQGEEGRAGAATLAASLSTNGPSPGFSFASVSLDGGMQHNQYSAPYSPGVRTFDLPSPSGPSVPLPPTGLASGLGEGGLEDAAAWAHRARALAAAVAPPVAPSDGGSSKDPRRVAAVLAAVRKRREARRVGHSGEEYDEEVWQALHAHTAPSGHAYAGYYGTPPEAARPPPYPFSPPAPAPVAYAVSPPAPAYPSPTAAPVPVAALSSDPILTLVLNGREVLRLVVPAGSSLPRPG